MTLDDEPGRYASKRDRLARLTRLVAILQAHPEGMRTGDIAARVGMSVRTVYRDLTALEDELRLPVWGEDGTWGIDSEKAFLPPLKLTQAEAMAVVLSARLMVRYADKYDPDLAAAFEKLERGLPPPLAEHVERTLDGLSKAPRDERFSANVRLLTRAWAERRVVTIDYEPARYESGAVPRRATVRPFLLEPSLQTHALYLIGFDEERGALRTFKIERIRSAALTPRTFEPPDPAATTSALRAAWDIIADQEPVEIVLRFVPGRRRTCPRGDLAPDADAGRRGRRLAALARDGVRDDRDPAVDPVVGRRGRGHRTGLVARRRGRHAPAGARALRSRRGWGDDGREHDAGGRDWCGHEAVMRRHPFAAVNLISDPIHGYVELTKRLTAPELTAAGLPAEDVAEEDLLDTAWLQRLRRISQLQSARWVFPTAEHSRFTHGLGVMHEAGLWARALYPSLRSTLAGLGESVPSEGLVVETLRMAGLLHDVGHGPFAHFFDDHVLAAFDAPADARRPAGKRLTHEDLSGRIIEDELGPLLAGLRRAPGAVAERDALADDEAIDPRWVSFLVSKPALADPSMPRWVRWLQPLLSACSPSTTSTTSGAMPT